MGELKFIPIEPGGIVSYKERNFRITYVTSMTQVLADPLDGGKAELLPVEMLRQPIPEKEPTADTADGTQDASGEQKIARSKTRGHKDLQSYSKDEIKEGQRRLAVIRPLLKNTERTLADVEKVAKAEGVDPSTIYLWLKRFQDAGHSAVLIPLPRGVRLGTRFLQPEVEAIMRDVFDRMFLVRRPKSHEEIIEEIQKLCSAPQPVQPGAKPLPPLKVPHANTIRRRIHAIPKARVLEAQGRLEELQKLQPIKGKVVSSGPMGLVQIDHWHSGVEIVDEVYRLPIGVPWITVAIDVYSRMVAGYYISVERPTAASAGMAVSMAMCPKAEFIAEKGITGKWPVWGRIGILHADNAPEFCGRTLERACRKYHIDPVFRPVKTPHYGGHIERLLGTFKTEMLKLSGAIVDRQSTGAVYTQKEFETQFLDMVVNIYHERPHAGINDMSPRAKWVQGVEGDGLTLGLGIPRVPGDPMTVKIDFMPYVMRPIHPYGVKIQNIKYNSDVLYPFINTTVSPKSKVKQKYIFHRSDEDISRVYWWDEETQLHYTIPYWDVSLPPMSLPSYKEIQKYLKGRGLPINEQTIAEANERMSQRDKEAAAKTKGAKSARLREEQRSRAAKAKGKHDPPGTKKHHPGHPKPPVAKDGGDYDKDIFKQPIEPSDGLEVW
jgi:putative transposase